MLNRYKLDLSKLEKKGGNDTNGKSAVAIFIQPFMTVIVDPKFIVWE